MENKLLLTGVVETRAKGFPVTLLTQFYLSIGITHLLTTAKVVSFNSSLSPHRRGATGASVYFHTSSQYLLGRFTTCLQLKRFIVNLLQLYFSPIIGLCQEKSIKKYFQFCSSGFQMWCFKISIQNLIRWVHFTLLLGEITKSSKNVWTINRNIYHCTPRRFIP